MARTIYPNGSKETTLDLATFFYLCRRSETALRIRLFYVVHLLVVAAGAVGQAEDNPNLVRNGDFEQVVDGRPADWTLSERPNVATWSVDRGRAGGRSLRLEVQDFQEGWVIVHQDNVVPLEAGREYRLTFWHRAENLAKATPGGWVAIYRIEPWSSAGLSDTGFFPGREWTRHTVRFRAAQTCRNTRLEFWLCQTGTLWIDDVSLVLAEDEPPAAFWPARGVANRVPNGSFEVGPAGWATYGWDTLLGTVDRRTAAHGRASFRLDFVPGQYPEYWQDWPDPGHQPIHDLGLANLGWLELPQGKPCTFSAALKSEPPGLPVRMWVQGVTGPLAQHDLPAAGDWQTESFTFTPTRKFGFVVIQAFPPHPEQQRASLWIDAVRLAEGPEATPYRPRRPVEVGVSTEAEANLFDLGTPPQLRVTVARWSEESAKLQIAVTDFDNRKIWEQTLPLRGRVGTPKRLAVTPKLPGTGFYRAEWKVVGPDWQEEGQLRFGVLFPWLAKYAQAEAFYGMNHPYPSDLRMRLARRCGLGWTRDWSLSWDVVEKEKGRFDWSASREVIERDRAFGFRVQECLGHPSSRWATTGSTDPQVRTGEGEPAYRWYPPRSLDDWEAYVYAVVNEWKGTIRQYEILNEPWWKYPGGRAMTAEEYVEFARRGYQGAKRAWPDCIVIGGQGGSPADEKRYGALYAAGLLQWCDAVCFHPYGEYSQKDFDSLFRVMEEHGSRKEVWNTEYASYADEDPDPTAVENVFSFTGPKAEALAAESIVRQHARLLSAGFRVNMQHIHHWPLRVNTEGLPFDMLFEYGGVPRKTYVAMNVQAWLIPPGSVPEGHVADESGFSVYVFRAGTHRVGLVWSAQETDLNPAQRRAVAGRNVRVRNLMGHPIPPPHRIGPQPVYVETDARGAAALRRAFAAK